MKRIERNNVEKSLESKRSALQARLKRYGSLAVAYSGGVDSAYIAWAAHQALGSRMLAVIADSPSLARHDYRDALRFADEHAIPLRVIETSELENQDYAKNGADRCFYCKDELFAALERLCVREGFSAIAYGKNADDERDYRPGQRAAQSHGVIAPLAEVGLAKSEIRELARRAGLSVWDKPASACLASRIEYGRPVTREALKQVEQAEEVLRQLGFRQFRVRHHGEIARVEVAREEMSAAIVPEVAARMVREIKRAGFAFVALDLEGYRQGSLNALLPASDLAAGRS